MKYQKKPVVVEAWKTFRDYPNVGLDFDNGSPMPLFDAENGQWTIYDELHDTDIKFEPGDWIIKGLKGEFYPCKPDVFESSYEPVEWAAAEALVKTKE